MTSILPTCGFGGSRGRIERPWPELDEPVDRADEDDAADQVAEPRRGERLRLGLLRFAHGSSLARRRGRIIRKLPQPRYRLLRASAACRPPGAYAVEVFTASSGVPVGAGAPPAASSVIATMAPGSTVGSSTITARPPRTSKSPAGIGALPGGMTHAW